MKTPDQHANVIDSAFGQPIYHNRLRFAVKDAIQKSIAAEHDRIIAMLNTIKDGIGDLDAVDGYWLRVEIDACIDAIRAHRPD